MNYAESYERSLAEYDALVQGELESMSPEVIAKAKDMARDPKLMDTIAQDYHDMGMEGETDVCMAEFAAASSRNLDDPLSTMTRGCSGSGKSRSLDITSELTPPESQIKATHMTPKAIYHAAFGQFIHRAVFLGEREHRKDDEQANATKALREMKSSKFVSIAVTENTGNGFVTAHKMTPGPIACLETTAADLIFKEDANRSLHLWMNGSPEQTERVIHAKAVQATGGSVSRVSRDEIVERHHALQRMLRRVDVVIPFAGVIAHAMPYDRVEARRAFDFVVQMVKAIAMLHQFQRTTEDVEHGTRIEASIADYVVARELLLDPLGFALGQTFSKGTGQFAKNLREHFGDDPFAPADAAKAILGDIHESTVRRYLAELRTEGIVEVVTPSAGRRAATYRAVREPESGGAKWLPTGDEIESDAGGDPPKPPRTTGVRRNERKRAKRLAV